MKTLAEVMAGLPEKRRHKIEARAQELIMEENARRAKQQSGNGTDDAFTLDAPIEIEDAESVTRPAD